MKNTFALALLLIGCSADPPPPPDLFPPTASFVFPGPLSMTDAAQLTVSGRAADDVSVAGVSVNGVEAVSTDGFRTWRAVVPLVLGVNLLRAEVRDGIGQVVPDASNVTVTRVSPLWAAPAALAFSDTTAYVADGSLDRVFMVDLAGGARTPLNGTGPSFAAPTGVAIDGTRLLVSDAVLQTIFAVDMTTGARSVLAQGPPFASPQAVAVDAAGGRALVPDSILGLLFGVDLATGARTTVAAGFNSPRGVAVDAAGNRAFVVDLDGVHEVDLASGLATLTPVALSVPRGIAFDTGSGHAIVLNEGEVLEVDTAGGGVTVITNGISFPRDLVVDPARVRALIVDSADDRLLEVDLATGFSATISGTQFGAGPKFVNPRDVAIDVTRGRAVVIDFTAGLFTVDLATGRRVLVEGPGPAFVTPLGVAFDGALNRALVTDSGWNGLLDVFLASGDRAFITNTLAVPVDVSLDALNGVALVADTTLLSVVAVDLLSGATTVVSAPGRGSGPAFVVPRALDWSDRLLVVDDGIDALLEVDRITGDRRLFAGAGPAFASPSGVAADLARNRALVTDTGLDAIVAIDLDSGDRVLLSGSGPPLLTPDAIAVSSDLILVIDSGTSALVAIEPVSGDRVIISK